MVEGRAYARNDFEASTEDRNNILLVHMHIYAYHCFCHKETSFMASYMILYKISLKISEFTPVLNVKLVKTLERS